MADAGFKLTVEGEKEFKRALKEIDNALKTNRAELKLATEQYKASDGSVEALAEVQKSLGDTIDAQKKKLETQRAQYEASTAAVGENDAATVKLRQAMLETETQITKLTAEYEKNEAKITDVRDGTAALSDALADAEALIAANTSESKMLAEQLAAAGDKMKGTAREEETLKKQGDLLAASIEAQRKKVEALNAQMERSAKATGDTSRETLTYKKQMTDATAELAKMEKELAANKAKTEALNEPALDVLESFKKLTGEAGVKLPEGLDKVIELIGGSSALSLAGAAGVALGAVAKITAEFAKGAKEAENYAASLGRLSDKSGVDTTTLQELQYVADVTGVSMDALIDVLKDLRKNMYDASEGNEEMNTLFAKLGVNIRDSNGELRDAVDVLFETGDAFKAVSNETERAAMMEKLLGGSSREMNTLFYEGAANLRLLREEAHTTGYVMGEELTQKMENAARAGREASIAWKTVWRNVSAIWNTQWGALLSGDFKTAFSESETKEYSENVDAALKKWWTSVWKKSKAYSESAGENMAIYPGTHSQFANAYDNARAQEQIERFKEEQRARNGTLYGTQNVYNVEIKASDIKEISDIAEKAASARVRERMG